MPYQLHNRRYTGSKLKISDWISGLIMKNCTGKSFVDLFAGTAIMAYKMLPFFKEIIINDNLFSNKIIYDAFFSKGVYDMKKLEKIKKNYVNINSKNIKENYVSINFGGKFFSESDARIIGYIREDIEAIKNKLTKKEHDILVASLLYSMDRCANTVGHYDAYIKHTKIFKSFSFDLIKPIATNGSKIYIYREDSNNLVKKMKADIVYIDPPYNSRQYSRFYHVLENITQWKKPKLYGIAQKPKPENMSEYCKNKASKVFQDLIGNLKCKYIVVSYNNTYNSKSKSSVNKIGHKFIKDTLKKRGKTVIFEAKHNFFNAGKTDFSNHLEYIFITKIGG